MTDPKPSKTYIIRNKESKELFHARSGKTSWKAPGHAKNAFNQSLSDWNVKEYGLKTIPDPRYWDMNNTRTPLFSEQDVYEIVELKPESEDKLTRALEILEFTLGRCDSAAFDMIYDFLEENK